jgi:hypothetical protein
MMSLICALGGRYYDIDNRDLVFQTESLCMFQYHALWARLPSNKRFAEGPLCFFFCFFCFERLLKLVFPPPSAEIQFKVRTVNNNISHVWLHVLPTGWVLAYGVPDSFIQPIMIVLNDSWFGASQKLYVLMTSCIHRPASLGTCPRPQWCLKQSGNTKLDMFKIYDQISFRDIGRRPPCTAYIFCALGNCQPGHMKNCARHSEVGPQRTQLFR